VVETLGISRNDRWLFGSNGCHNPTYYERSTHPEQVMDGTGTGGVYRSDIQKGQEVFLKYGLMEHGSLWGHGAYLGPDYSAEYLHRLSEVTPRYDRDPERYGKLFAQLSPDEQSAAFRADDSIT